MSETIRPFDPGSASPPAAEGAAKPVPYPLAPELKEELEAASRSLESATPHEIIQWAVAKYHPTLTMATAFGPEGCYILYLLSKIEPKVPVFNLDTGYQFAETLALRERILEKYGIAVEMKRPDTTVEQYEALHGGPLYKTEPDRCCHDRKIVVLRRSVVGYTAWMSAIRRDQSSFRANAPIVGWDGKFGLVKINPLANCTKKFIWNELFAHEIPYNELHDNGYTSIGCWPCTRAVGQDEDERAGRWVGFAKTECGLHTSN